MGGPKIETKHIYLLQRAAVFVLMQIVVLPEVEQIAEVFHEGRWTGRASCHAYRVVGIVESQWMEVAWHLSPPVSEHQEDQCCIEAADVFLSNDGNNWSLLCNGIYIIQCSGPSLFTGTWNYGLAL